MSDDNSFDAGFIKGLAERGSSDTKRYLKGAGIFLMVLLIASVWLVWFIGNQDSVNKISIYNAYESQIKEISQCKVKPMIVCAEAVP